MPVPFWIDGRDNQAASWDYVWIGETLLPGVIKEFKIDSKNSLDVGKAQGNTGAPVTPKGRLPRTMSITVQVTTQDAWNQWDDVLKNLNLQGADAKQRSFSITHPLPAKFGVTSIYIESCSLPMPSPVNGITFTLTCTENIPPKPVNNAKNQSKAKVGNPVPDFGSAGFPTPSNDLA